MLPPVEGRPWGIGEGHQRLDGTVQEYIKAVISFYS